MAQLTMKDMRILNVLDKDPTVSLSEVAKKAGISKQVADYRIKKLIEQKTIYGFYAVVNLGKLGYSLFRLHIKLKNVSHDKYPAFANYLLKNYPTFWVGFVSGSFDLIVDIWAKGPSEFQNYLKDILNSQKDIIYSYESFQMLSLNMFSYNYFLSDKYIRRKGTIFQESSIVKIDQKDIKILNILKDNSRISYEEVGKKVSLTRNAVKHRILELEKDKVISGYHMMVHFRDFNRLSYKIFIEYDHAHIDQEDNLLSFLESYSGVLAYARLFGRWNLDIEVQPHDAKELQELLINLRSKFNIIQNYEVIQIIEDFGLNFFPI